MIDQCIYLTSILLIYSILFFAQNILKKDEINIYKTLYLVPKPITKLSSPLLDLDCLQIYTKIVQLELKFLQFDINYC